MLQITKSIRKRDGNVHKTKTICKNRTIKIYQLVQVHSNSKTAKISRERGKRAKVNSTSEMRKFGKLQQVLERGEWKKL